MGARQPAEERKQWAHRLLEETFAGTKVDRWWGTDQVRVYLNMTGWRTWRASALIRNEDVRRWARNGLMPTARGAGGKRPVVVNTLMLIAWLTGGQQCVRPDRYADGQAHVPAAGRVRAALRAREARALRGRARGIESSAPRPCGPGADSSR